MVKYMENVAHAHAVDTRPSLPSPAAAPQSEGLGTRLYEDTIPNIMADTSIMAQGH